MKKVLFLAIATLAVASSCNESVLDTTNPNRVTTESYFTTLGQITSSLTAAYAGLQNNQLGGREYFFLHDLRSDDMKSGGGQLETPRNQLLTGSHSNSNPVMNDVWNGFHKVIHRANTVIVKGAELTVPTADQPLLDRYIAEAKFLRALAYYNLGGFWGGVPIYEAFGTALTDAKPRSTQTEVFDFAIADLSAAKDKLPTTYSAADNGRATKGAAMTLAAKIYLFKGDYASAKTQLEAVKALGIYSLVGNYFDNFSEETEYNGESIFEVSYNSNGGYNWDGNGNDYGPNESWIRSQEYSAVGWRNLIPSDNLMAAYEANDPRVTDTFWFIGDMFANGSAQLTDARVQGNTTTFNATPQKISWKKYSIMYKLDPGGFYDKNGMNYRMMRYADVLLMLAECENEAGAGGAAAAIGYLNQVRDRASVSMAHYGTATVNAAGYPVSTQAEIRKAIQHERQVELAGEEVRNFDILRWRKNGKLTGPEPISYFQASKYEFLPIPLDEININPNIAPVDQNPGY